MSLSDLATGQRIPATVPGNGASESVAQHDYEAQHVSVSAGSRSDMRSTTEAVYTADPDPPPRPEGPHAIPSPGDLKQELATAIEAEPTSTFSVSGYQQVRDDDHDLLELDIAEYPQAELVLMLSTLLTKITTSNDNLHSGANPVIPPKPGSPLLAFHARNIPSISIQAYLSRILKYCPMSSDIFLSLLVYFDRMSKAASSAELMNSPNSFTSTKQLMGNEQYPFSIDSYNVHRLVITGIVVASKFCSDVFYTNSRYAKVCTIYVIQLSKALTLCAGWWPSSL